MRTSSCPTACPGLVLPALSTVTSPLLLTSKRSYFRERTYFRHRVNQFTAVITAIFATYVFQVIYRMNRRSSVSRALTWVLLRRRPDEHDHHRIRGLLAIAGFLPFRGTNVYHYLDSLNWVHGRHSFTFGGEFRRCRKIRWAILFCRELQFQAVDFEWQRLESNARSGCTVGGGNICKLSIGIAHSASRNDELNGLIRGRRWKEYRGFVEDNWTR